MMIGEFGTDWRGWRREQDPFLRGWRRDLGGGVGRFSRIIDVLVVGTNPERELVSVLHGAGRLSGPHCLGQGTWTPLAFQTSGEPPVAVGEPVVGGKPFIAQLPLNSQWGAKLKGQLASPIR